MHTDKTYNIEVNGYEDFVVTVYRSTYDAIIPKPKKGQTHTKNTHVIAVIPINFTYDCELELSDKQVEIAKLIEALTSVYQYDYENGEISIGYSCVADRYVNC